MARVNIADANQYFETEVLHSKPWDKATQQTRQKALLNAERILYRYYSKDYDNEDPGKLMPAEAIYEQALWLLRQDDTIQKAELGIIGVSVSGIQVQSRGKAKYIAPEARRIVAQHKGSSGFSWMVM